MIKLLYLIPRIRTVINFTNTVARRLLKLELKISLCSGFILKAGPKFLKFCVDDPCTVLELWSKFQDKRRTLEKIINHARAAVRTGNSSFCLLFLLIYSRAILRSSL